ncbi:MAG: Fic family protein, partial [Opitutaceae bacterium]|nr:Fic family protein [Cytophagales bacterium]
MRQYIHQLSKWPSFSWDYEALLSTLGRVRNLQGQLKGQMINLGFNLKDEANLETTTLDILKSSEIEGEFLNPEQVRSSVARHLGLEISGLVPSDRNVDGVVEMLLDATIQHKKPLNKERLFNWHSSLFPAGRSGTHKIVVGNWRDDATGPMQVVSGAMGKEKVHFETPAAPALENEMVKFLTWFNSEDHLDPVLKAGISHFWFVTIHPFDDGNGRIARAIADMQLSRADDSTQRFYSMSAQRKVERKQYYDILEKTQKGDLDIIDWLVWFINCLMSA